jgi:hypothetical protein
VPGGQEDGSLGGDPEGVGDAEGGHSAWLSVGVFARDGDVGSDGVGAEDALAGEFESVLRTKSCGRITDPPA